MPNEPQPDIENLLQNSERLIAKSERLAKKQAELSKKIEELDLDENQKSKAEKPPPLRKRKNE